VGEEVAPNTQDQDHTLVECLTHLGQTTLGGEVVRVTEGLLDISTVLVRNGVVSLDTRNVDLGVLDDLSVLQVDTANFRELTSATVAASEELCDNSHLLGGIDSLALTQEGLVAHTERVEVTAVLVARRVVTISWATTSIAITTLLGNVLTGVGCDRGGHAVGLPDVHLHTAGAVLTISGVLVVRRRLPILDIGLAVDELDVARALSIAVSSTVLGTGLVVGETGLATILVHGHEVESAIETARKLRHVNIKGELLVLELEHLVVVVVLHEVDTGADIGRVRSVSNEFEREGASRGCDTICTSIVRTIERTLLGAGRRVGAVLSVPSVTSVTIGRAIGGMCPTPVGVQNDGAGFGGAATTS